MNINDYSAVYDYGRDIWVLCENENLQNLREKIASENKEGLPDYNTLEYCVNPKHGWLDVGNDEEIESMYCGSIIVSEYDCIKELRDNFDKYISNNEVNKVLNGEVCLWKFLRTKVDGLYKVLMVRCCENLLDEAKNMTTPVCV